MAVLDARIRFSSTGGVVGSLILAWRMETAKDRKARMEGEKQREQFAAHLEQVKADYEGQIETIEERDETEIRAKLLVDQKLVMKRSATKRMSYVVAQFMLEDKALAVQASTPIQPLPLPSCLKAQNPEIPVPTLWFHSHLLLLALMRVWLSCVCVFL